MTDLVAQQRQYDCEAHDCVEAFKSGKKHMAEQLLPHTRPAVVRTWFQFRVLGVVAMVSLLHLAANWRDDEKNIPLHYATSNG